MQGWNKDNLSEALLRNFGHTSFLEGQLETIQQLLNGNDVALVMPTGSGKSLCYQLTALLMPGLTLVVSPLIALMKDQVDALQAKAIEATFINSSLSIAEISSRLNGMRNGRYKMVYVAPERFRNHRFKEALAECNVSLLTIDEAHCISQWGHDFRPDYLNLKTVVCDLEDARILAVTATATAEVRRDIIVQLGMDGTLRPDPKVLITGFSRPNLFLKVSLCATHKSKFSRLNSVITEYKSGIVYCSTRKMVERVAAMLTDTGVKALTYHGAMTDKLRSETQNQFMSAAFPVVVATNAFGMGVDRGDLNFIVHWDVPGSIEAYYQEVGRAGRNGQRAWCELLFNYADVRTQKFFIDGANPDITDVCRLKQVVEESCIAEGEVTCTLNEWAGQSGIKNSMAVGSIMAMLERAGLIEREKKPGKRSYTVRLIAGSDQSGLEAQLRGLEEKRGRDNQKLDKLLQFVYSQGCRHNYILSYFGEHKTDRKCGGCDRCGSGAKSGGAVPSAEQWVVIQKILSCTARMQGRFGARRIAAVLRGDKDDAIERHHLHELPTFGIMKGWSAKDILAVIDVLQIEGCLEQSPDVYRMISLTDKGRKVMLKKESGFMLCWPENLNVKVLDVSSLRTGTTKATSASPFSPPFCESLARNLRDWAASKAGAAGLPVYHILSRKTIEAIASAAPANFSELGDVKGMGPVKVQRFGREILDIVARYN